MKNNIFILKSFLVMLFLGIVGCQEYVYDFENGYDIGDTDPSEITTDTTGFEVDKSMYEQARIFPGLVDEREERIVDTVISFDLSRQYIEPSVLGITTVPQPILSTGLYGAPGELIEITVPEGIYGLTAQIGSHMDDLTGMSPTKRAPLIYTVAELFPGINRIRNPFGGYLWLWTKQNFSGTTNLKFTGAVKAPDYILGTTPSVEAWENEVINSYVPWLELRSDHVALTVPRDWVVRGINSGELSNVEELMMQWEKIIVKDYDEFMGLYVGNSDYSHRAPDFPVRGVLDAQLEGGVYAHDGGQPFVAQNTKYWFDEWTNMEMLTTGQSWGTFRSLGYNYQPINSPWWTGLEDIEPNLFAFKIAGDNPPPTLGTDGVYDIFPLAIEYADPDASNNLANDAEADNWVFKLTPFIQLFQNIENPETGESGWDFYPYLLERWNDSTSVGTDDMSKRNFFYTTLSDFTQVDYGGFFDAWGIAITDFAREYVSNQYDPLKTTLWKYNPITREGGDEPYTGYKLYISRINWILSANSEATNEGELNTLYAILDGDSNTYWHSCWADCDPPYSLPHIITGDMQQLNDITGFYVTSRRNQTHPRVLEIEISKDRVSWENLGAFSLEDTNDKQFFDFPMDKEFQYFRITIPENNYGNEIFAAIAEFGFYKKP